jgi:cytolysin (calcineurin-like family phosphatase)
VRSKIYGCLLLVLLAGLIPLACRSSSPIDSARKGNLDATFLVTADLHFGGQTVITPPAQNGDIKVTCVEAQKIMIAEMNSIAGKPFPQEFSGQVGKPLGLLVAGDLTNSGAIEEWNEFVKLYGLTGAEGLLKMPVYESVGNHDLGDKIVKKGVIQRHKADHYSWDAGDLHIICLGEPNNKDLAFLKKDLEPVGHLRPIVIYFHYSIVGPYSDEYWFGADNHRAKFADAMKGYNIVALIHGHFHGSGWYKWKGYDVYDVGAVPHGWKDFIVLHVTDTRLTVGAWNYEGTPGWWWAHSKPINGESGGEIAKTYPHPGAHERPCIPHPTVDNTTSKH